MKSAAQQRRCVGDQTMPSSSHSSVAGNFERLRLNSDNGMPPITRAMSQAQRPVRAGSSGNADRLSGVSNPGRSGRSSRTPTARPRGNEVDVPENAEEDSDDDDDDDDDDEDDDEPPQRRRPSAFWEIWSVYDPSCLTPRELVQVGRSTTRYSEATQRFKALGDVFSRVEAIPTQVQQLEQISPRPQRAEELVRNMEIRYNRILARLEENLRTGSGGRDVIDTVDSLRDLFNAIDGLIRDFPARSRRLVDLLFSVLNWIFHDERNRDLFQGRSRASYVDASNHGNVYKRFISPNGQPLQFFNILVQQDPGALHDHREHIERLVAKFWERHTALHRESDQEPSQTESNVMARLQSLRVRAGSS